MFTGIVEELGEVIDVQERTVASVPDGTPAPSGSDGQDVARVRRLWIRASTVTSDMKAGDSVAVDGVCLSAADLSADRIAADLVSETLNRTSLGGLNIGSRVNLERPIVLGGRMDGHLVQGHVDAVGCIQERTSDDVLRIALPDRLQRYVVEKGSIAVDGISLTVVEVDESSFTVALIPTTMATTTLGSKGVDDLVNLEVDVVAKYLERLTEATR